MRPSPRAIGLPALALTFAADQVSKLWLLFSFDLPAREPVAVGPFMNLIVVWNHGVSYGLFQQQTELGRWLLVGVSVVASLVMAAWLRRAESPVLGLALGLIMGGALGNVIDRIAYGAVFDFVHLHAGGHSWYVFNIADAAIVAGVAALLYDSLLADRRRPRVA
ncbi:MAG: signal peptidase II [Methylobacteriaceae bacterium]|nr:signal peptidase II [Methylobacteriaceae bacterium]